MEAQNIKQVKEELPKAAFEVSSGKLGILAHLMIDPEGEQTAPKMLGMFYTSNDSPSKSVFTSSLFQMEPSPRHQRKALNISEPFAVSVPLRVSAVISTNSTPCRTPPKELQSLSSLEEFSFQGSESGGWPEEEKPPGAETSTGKGRERVCFLCKR